jgi:hypothetical protein
MPSFRSIFHEETYYDTCSDHQHVEADKTVERLTKDYERTSSQLDAVLEDLTNVEIVYDLKQRELNRQQETCFNDEASVKVGRNFLLNLHGSRLPLIALTPYMQRSRIWVILDTVFKRLRKLDDIKVPCKLEHCF